MRVKRLALYEKSRKYSINMYESDEKANFNAFSALILSI